MKTRLIFIAFTLAIVSSVNAQVINPKETAKRKVEDRTNRKADDTIDKGLDKLEEGIGNIFKKKDKKQKDEKSNTSTNSANSGNVSDSESSSSARSNSKFDFEAGDKVLYFDNFERLNIGDFPAEFNTTASGEIVTVNGKSGKWLSMTKNGAFIPESIQALPENFTLEFEIGITGNISNNYSGLGVNFTTNNDDLFKDVVFFEGSLLYLHPGDDLLSVQILPKNGTEINNQIPMPQWSKERKPFAKVSIWRQSGRLRMYVNEDKLIDMPRFFLESQPYKMAFFRRFLEDCEVYITNIRFAIAGEDTRSKLITDGKFVTNGILFDVNSDNIKTESGAVLKEIASTLQENPTVRVKIIGHTDSDGDASTNLTLSQKRALAVKNALINFYGINASRMETDGKGESQPVQSNNTTSGKAQNRRVEFIKL
ncbi:OmpA family protein [Sphingobacterium olei]|uniref:OmpA family protein n=1 Tax=Sphingobacterium olei TaxID=2571155 RepID=A0A4U0PFD9_9SPHI|nr:OmpA family protein [Sphingobacterium olei]TJZ61484.1 OmpA family protein [Sphingobacterium olei]